MSDPCWKCFGEMRRSKTSLTLLLDSKLFDSKQLTRQQIGTATGKFESLFLSVFVDATLLFMLRPRQEAAETVR